MLGADPFSGAVLVFRSRRADRVKILVWDGSGMVLIWKQLDTSKNPVPWANTLAAMGDWRRAWPWPDFRTFYRKKLFVQRLAGVRRGYTSGL